MANGERSEQRFYAAQLRAAGARWAEIAEALRRRYPDLGTLASLRVAHGWSQSDAARHWTERWPERPITFKRIYRWERWPAKGDEPSLPVLARLAELYECSVSDLVQGLADFTHLDTYPDGVDRRSFLGGAFATAAIAATASPAPQFLDFTGTRLGVTDISRIRLELARLYEIDAAAGGTDAYRRAIDQAAAVRQLLHTATYNVTVGRDLQILAGELTEMAGWLAFDAGHHGTARGLFNEALSVAQVVGSPQLTVLIMASMTLQASSVGSGREAVQIAQAAQRTAHHYASDRLRSLLLAREGLGHARAGDFSAAAFTLHQAEKLIDAHDDPGEEWLSFWGPADYQCAVGGAHLNAGASGPAKQAYRVALDLTPDGQHRNQGIYRARLAQALAAGGDIDEAAAMATTAAGGVCSGRTAEALLSLQPDFEAHAEEPVVAEALEALTSVA
jgi:hypothetical protein